MQGRDFFTRFARHAGNRDLTAIDQSGVSVRYPELMAHVEALEYRLPDGIHVVVKMPKSVDYLALLLACIKKGLSFTSLDPAIPEERLAFILADLGKDACVVETLQDIPEQTGSIVPGELAYIAYTSGSTGNPKGVKISYAGLANTIDQQIQAFNINHETRFFWLLSQGFDASLSDIFVTLLSGGTLVIPEASLSGLVRSGHIEALFNRNRITHSDIPPSLLKRLEPSKFTSLSTIVVGGEVAEKSVLKRFSESGFEVFNVYGPTEASICSSMIRCTPDFQTASIGYPLANMDYAILDPESGKLIEQDGQSGELVISGIGLAMGYTQATWNQKRFLSRENQFLYRTGDRVYRKNGEYFFVGRIDRQFKHNGQLVCPEEIEAALVSHDDVTNASVYYSGRRIVASIESDSSLTERDLRDHLSRYLPAYMIPATYEFSGELVLNGNAKVDHREIESSNLLKTVTECFKHRLGLTVINPELPLSDLGGDSLALMDVILDLEDQGFQVNMDKVAANDSVTGISESLMQGKGASEPSLEKDIASLPDSPDEELIDGNLYGEDGGVLLTGATGFLGIHLLNDLVRTGREVTVLVRAQSKGEALQRLQLKSDREGLTINFSSVTILLGDVSKERMGLSAEDYRDASNGIGMIIHSAAVVNNLKSLSQIHESNVKAMKILADFSRSRRKKVIHNISSLSVLVSKKSIPATLPEDIVLTSEDARCYSGYAQSKWLGEYYLDHNKDRIDFVNYRPGLLLPKRSAVTIDKHSFLHQLVSEIDCVGELPIGTEHFSFDITPVDLASQTICRLALSGSVRGNHHITTDKTVSLWELSKYLETTWIPAQEWVEKYRSATIWLYFYELHGVFPQFNLFETTRVDTFSPGEAIALDDKRTYLIAYLSHILGRSVK